MKNVTSSGRKTASVAISARSSKLVTVLVETDGTNAATVTIYDNASAASGVILFKAIVPGSVSTAMFNIASGTGVDSNSGLYMSISGTGAAANIYYSA